MVKINIKKKKFLIKIYIAAVLLIIVFFFIPLPYIVIFPGGVFDLGNIVNVSNTNHKTSNHFYAVSAKVYYNPYAKFLGLSKNNDNVNLFTLIIAKLSPNTKIVKTSKDYLSVEDEKIGNFYSNITEESNKISKELALKYLDMKENHTISIGPLSGSSGSLMISLEIINQLSTKDIISGRKIAGTGELAKNGSVIAVSGIMQKVHVAEKNKMDILIVPAANKKDINTQTKLRIIYADNLTNTIQELRDLS